MIDLKNAMSAFASSVDANAPTILAFAAVAGVVVTTVITAKKAPKIHEIMERKKLEYSEIAEGDSETKRVVVKEAAKEIIPEAAPIVIFGGLTIGCILMSNKIHLAREAALTTAYIAADQSLKEWKKAASETLDKKDLEKVEEKVRENNFTEAVGQQGVKKTLLPGEHVFLDRASNQIFYGDLNRILRIVDQINHTTSVDGTEFVTWNELLRELGEKTIPSTTGSYLGFNSVDGGIDIDYGSYVDDDTNIIFGYIDYHVKPRFAYDYC